MLVNSTEIFFSEEVISRLKYYVYRLIDPRNGETFYVGKGQGNRVFSHSKGELLENNPSEKLKRIWQIRNSGLDVLHIIHRHGIKDEKAALEVEAALMDAYSGITNISGGHGSADFGPASAFELIRKYSAETLEIQHKILFITVNSSVDDYLLYEAVRFAWRLNMVKAMKADVILALQTGVVVGVFTATEWLPATIENFPGKETIPGRYGFIGKHADKNLELLYLGKRIPDCFRKKGASNPIKYSW